MSLLDPAEFARLREDIAFARALRKLRVISPSGEIPIYYQPGALNALLDLRSLTPTGAPPALQLPDAAGYTDAYLTTDGATLSWVQLDPETITWRDAITAAGGTFAARSILIADRLIKAIKAESFTTGIKYLLPLLGGDLTAARMPLRDSLGVGIAGNTGFTDADFSQSTGLQGDGSSKYLDSHITPGQLGASDNAGLGWWENNYPGVGNVEPMGAYKQNNTPDNRFSLDLRTFIEVFGWGTVGSGAASGGGAGNHHYYGQRASGTDRRIFKNGTQVGATSTSVTSTAGSTDNTIILSGCNTGVSGIAPWPGRCAVTYMTDGTLTAGEIAAFHTLLQTYLIAPTGR